MSIVNRVKAGLSAASNMLSGKKAALKEKLAAEMQPAVDAQPTEATKEEAVEQPVQPTLSKRKAALSSALKKIAHTKPARKIGSNSKLPLQEQDQLQIAAVEKRVRRMKRSNGWSAS